MHRENKFPQEIKGFHKQFKQRCVRLSFSHKILDIDTVHLTTIPKIQPKQADHRLSLNTNNAKNQNEMEMAKK